MSNQAVVARVHDGRILVVAPYSEENLQKCKSVPGGRFLKAEKAWSYPASAASAHTVLEAFKGGTMRADQGFRELVVQYKRILDAAGIKSASDLPPIPFTKTEPWLHQLRAYHFSYNLNGAMLALDMGCGKSKVTVDLIINRGHQRTLICAPLSVIQEWPRQFRTHAGKPVICVPLDDKAGSVADKVKAARVALMQGEQEGLPVVIVTNYESVWREPWGPIRHEKTDRIIDRGFGLQAGFDCVVADEVHRIQSASAKASQYLGKLGEITPYRLGLSGTPLSSGPLSVYGQYRFLDPGIFGTNFQRFRSQYAVMGGYGGHQVIDYQNQEEFQRKFYSIAFRVLSRDVLDLPDEQHITRTCTLSPKERRAYNELEKEFVTQLQEGEVTVTNALTKLLRLDQITSGFVRLDPTEAEEGEVVRVGDSKQKLLLDILADLDPKEPVVVFCRFLHDLDVIKEACEKEGRKRRYAELSGRTKQTEAWREGEYDLIGVQLRAGGVGIDLTRSHTCIYYSMGYSLSDYQQSLARTLRPGQKNNVTYVHILAEKSVNCKVYDALHRKQNVVETLLADMR